MERVNVYDENSGINSSFMDARDAVSFASILAESERNEKLWIEKLKSEGYKACHPNDGWVDRKNHTVKFAYPRFNLYPKVGDLIILGDHHYPEENIPVKITHINIGTYGFCDEYGFHYLPSNEEYYAKLRKEESDIIISKNFEFALMAVISILSVLSIVFFMNYFSK